MLSKLQKMMKISVLASRVSCVLTFASRLEALLIVASVVKDSSCWPMENLASNLHKMTGKQEKKNCVSCLYNKIVYYVFQLFER